MTKKIIISFGGIIIGIVIGIVIIYSIFIPKNSSEVLINPLAPKRQVIGFLPYWLLNRAKSDYSKYITTLTYFGLRVDKNGNIQKLLTPQEEEPGWYALNSGKLSPFFKDAQNHYVSLSLLVSNGDINSIDQLVNDPIAHAKNLISDVSPIINKYKFSDLNLDIEYTQPASDSARTGFTEFVNEVRKDLNKNITLTVEISPTDVILNHLIDTKAIGKIADNVVLMAYDYHSTVSFVTGPVAPLGGAGVDSEYDVITALEKSLEDVPPEKLILGIPLYGYEWESLNPEPRSSIIPNTGLVASNQRAKDFLSFCSTCSARLDSEARENYISYFDQNALDYHTIFYPTENSTVSKINLANNFQLGGLAVWALGYEGNSILKPLEGYKNE